MSNPIDLEKPEPEVILVSDSDSDETENVIEEKFHIIKNEETTDLANVKGVGGFLNDLQKLKLEVARLKASEQAMKETVEGQQLALNSVSEEFCTLQAQLAKNEMVIEAQNVEVISLEKEASDLQKSNDQLEATLTLAIEGMGALFQSVCKIVEEIDANPSILSELGQLKTTEKAKSVNLQHVNLVIAKIKKLRDKCSRRMGEKLRAQHQFKVDLRTKHALLQNMGRLLHKSKRLLVRKKIFTVGKKARNLTPSSSAPAILVKSNTPRDPTKHARDYSFSLRNGYRCVCGERFKFMAPLHLHLGSGDNDKKFKCEVCNASFLYFNTLRAHQRQNHKRYQLPSTCQTGCRACGEMFSSRTELMRGWKHRNGKCLEKKKELQNSKN